MTSNPFKSVFSRIGLINMAGSNTPNKIELLKCLMAGGHEWREIDNGNSRFCVCCLLTQIKQVGTGEWVNIDEYNGHFNEESE
jgi:hypothetical protein